MFFDKSKVEYRISVEQDLTPVRGNALASGNDAEDKAEEDAIIERLDQGEVWAWAVVTVTASYNGLEASDHLGSCSYADEADFIKDAYYDSMKAEALKALEELVKNNKPKPCGMDEDDHLGCAECSPRSIVNPITRDHLRRFLSYLKSRYYAQEPLAKSADEHVDRYVEWLKAGEPE